MDFDVAMDVGAACQPLPALQLQFGQAISSSATVGGDTLPARICQPALAAVTHAPTRRRQRQPGLLGRFKQGSVGRNLDAFADRLKVNLISWGNEAGIRH